MKNFLLRHAALALAILLPITVAAQSAASAKAPRNEVTLSRAESRDLSNLRVELETVSKRFNGNAPQLDELRARIQAVERNEPWLLSFDFTGGPLSLFLDMLGRRKEISFNIVSASEPEDLNTPLPPFALHNANLPTVFEVVKNLLSTRGLALPFASGGDGNSNALVCVLTRVAAAPKPAGTMPTLFDSFPVGRYLNDQSIDDIVGAIRAGWELDPKHDKEALRMKFHVPTSILLVSGPPEAIQIAAKVISQLRGAFDKDSKSELRSMQPKALPAEDKR